MYLDLRVIDKYYSGDAEARKKEGVDEPEKKGEGESHLF